MSLSAFLQSLPEVKEAAQGNKKRLQSLYADFTPMRQHNGVGFEVNYHWWKRVLLDVARNAALDSGSIPDGSENKGSTSSVLVLDVVETLKSRLQLQGFGQPLALGTVLGEMAAEGLLASHKSFMQRLPSSRSWSSLVSSPAKWALKRLQKDPIEDPALFRELASLESWSIMASVKSWVLKDLVVEVANEMKSMQAAQSHSPFDALYSAGRFKKIFIKAFKLNERIKLDLIHERDWSIILEYLENHVHWIQMSSDGQVIKWILDQKGNKAPVNETERGIVAVESTIDALDAQIETIEAKIMDKTSEIQNAVKAERKPKAISLLKEKKALQDLLDKRYANRHQLKQVLTQIEQAFVDADVIKAYETSTLALKAVLDRPEMQRHRIDQTLEQLQETLTSQSDIHDAISNASGIQTPAMDVDAELQELMNEISPTLVKPQAVSVPSQVPDGSTSLDADLEKRLAALKLPTTATAELA